MTIQTLEFYNADWIIIPKESGVVNFRLIANPPVAASLGIVVFAKKTTSSTGQWGQLGKTSIDNIPGTLPGPGFQLPVQGGMDYVIRFQGEAHLLMPGFESITLGFDLSTENSPLSNLDGSKTASNSHAAGVNGNVFLRHA